MTREMLDDAERCALAEQRSVEKVRKRLGLKTIFGENYRPLIKVRIAHAVSHFWNSLQTVAESFNYRVDVEIEIILCPVNASDLDIMRL